MTGMLLPQGAECAPGWLLTQHQGYTSCMAMVCTPLGTLLWCGCPVHDPLLASSHSPGQLQQQVPKGSPSPSSAPSTGPGPSLVRGWALAEPG